MSEDIRMIACSKLTLDMKKNFQYKIMKLSRKIEFGDNYLMNETEVFITSVIEL